MSERKTSMEYLSCPSSEGIVSSMLKSFGVVKVEGRYPTGVKADALRSIADFFGGSLKATKSVSDGIAQRQSVRGKGSRGRITATPESVLTAVKSGKIDKAELEALLKSMA